MDTARRITVPDPGLLAVEKFQLLTPLKQFAGELLGDQRNAEGLCRLVEHGKPNQCLTTTYLTDTSRGFFETASANDVIQLLFDEIETQTYALDVLTVLLTNGELTVCHIGERTDAFIR